MSLSAEKIKEQLQDLIVQREKSAQNFQQCVGAIAVLSEQLNMITLEASNQNLEGDNNGEVDDRN